MDKEKLLNKQSKYTIFYDAFKSIKEAEWTQDTQENTKGVFLFQLAKKERKLSAMLEYLYLISPPYYVGSCLYGEGHLLYLAWYKTHQKYNQSKRVKW